MDQDWNCEGESVLSPRHLLVFFSAACCAHTHLCLACFPSQPGVPMDIVLNRFVASFSCEKAEHSHNHHNHRIPLPPSFPPLPQLHAGSPSARPPTLSRFGTGREPLVQTPSQQLSSTRRMASGSSQSCLARR